MQEDTANRREKVWRLMTRGITLPIMAELLNVTRQTIYADVQWWRQHIGR